MGTPIGIPHDTILTSHRAEGINYARRSTSNINNMDDLMNFNISCDSGATEFKVDYEENGVKHHTVFVFFKDNKPEMQKLVQDYLIRCAILFQDKCKNNNSKQK